MTRSDPSIPFDSHSHRARPPDGPPRPAAQIRGRPDAPAALQRFLRHMKDFIDNAQGFALFHLHIPPAGPAPVEVVFVSPSLSTILGVEEITDVRCWLETVVAEDRARVQAALTVFRERSRFSEVFRIHHRPTGQVRWLQVISTGGRDAATAAAVCNGILLDITERQRIETDLRRREEQLRQQSRHLQEVNVALKVLLKKRDEDQAELEQRITFNVKELIQPYLVKLAASRLDRRQRSCLNILRTNVEEVIGPYVRGLSDRYLELTPTEIQVANLIKQGKSTKDMAELLGLSPRTVESYRNAIRRKLGLKNKKVNLRTYLSSLG